MTKMTAVEILEAARAKIEKPEHWMQGYYARDAAGEKCYSTDDEAVCFCGYGAIEAVTGTTHHGRDWPYAASGALDAAVGANFPDFNDTHTHGEVLAGFDKAINQLKGETK